MLPTYPMRQRRYPVGAQNPARHHRGMAAQLVVIGTLAPCVLWPQPPGPVKSPSPRVRSLKWLARTGRRRTGTNRHVGTASGREACQGTFTSGGRDGCSYRWCLPAPREQEARSCADEGLSVNTGVQEASPRPEFNQLLLDAKFSVPRPRPGTVSRGDLAETARSSACRLVAVTAPAGYGKSTFLAEWAAAEDRRVAWVSLDRFDDDPAVLLVSLASAYCRAGLGGADLVADMGGPGVVVLGRAAPRLAAEFRASPVPFVVMLDDLHELHSTACHDSLSVVISGIPLGSQ